MRPFSAVPFVITVAGAAMSRPQDRLPEWLVGCWEHTHNAERTVQRWVMGRPGVMFGAMWKVRGAALVELDVMRLSATGDWLELDVIPLTGTPERLRAAAPDEGRTLRFGAAGGAARAWFDDLGRTVPCASVLDPPTSDASAIRRLHEADERAVVAGDADALERLWTDDIVALPPGSAPIVGRARNAEGLRRSLARSRDVITVAYRLRLDDTHVVGDYAIEWGGYEGDVRPSSGSATVTARGTMLRVIRRGSDGEWKVARTMFTTQ